MDSVPSRDFLDDIMSTHTQEMLNFRQHPLVDAFNRNLIQNGLPSAADLSRGKTELERIIDESAVENQRLLGELRGRG